MQLANHRATRHRFHVTLRVMNPPDDFIDETAGPKFYSSRFR